MSAAASNVMTIQVAGDAARGRPRCVLVVGDAALAKAAAEAAAAAGGGRVLTAPTMLMAIAAASAPATAPDWVIGSIEQFDPLGRGLPGVRTTASALRKVAARARVLLVTPPAREEQAVKALAAGVEDYVVEPGDLARVLGEEDDSGATSSTAAAGGGAAAATHDARDDVPDDELGDVDLIERLLEGRRGLHRVATRMIAARCDIPGVAWAANSAEAPAGAACVDVEFRGRRFGVLFAEKPDDAVQAELTSWAAWLGHWLALEDRLVQLQQHAMRDELTGLWNRRYFNRFLEKTLDEASRSRRQVTLLVFDIDDFKVYNDRHGHAAGDQILRETAKLMQAVVRDHDVVARIGGDEFAVIFWDPHGPRRPHSQHPGDVLAAAQRFQQAVAAHRFPRLIDGPKQTVTISGGLATFPWDGRTPADLLERADTMALRSKAQGKNAITFGPGATRMHATPHRDWGGAAPATSTPKSTH